MNCKTRNFFHAVELGFTTRVLRYLLQGVDINTVNEYQQNALAIAIIYDHIDLAKELIHRGIEIDRPDVCWYTPLFMAIIHEFEEIVTLIVNQGANCHFRNKNGESPFSFALEFRRMACLESMIAAKLKIDYPELLDVPPELTAILVEDMRESLLEFGPRAWIVPYRPDATLFSLALKLAMDEDEYRILDLVFANILKKGNRENYHLPPELLEHMPVTRNAIWQARASYLSWIEGSKNFGHIEFFLSQSAMMRDILSYMDVN